MDEESEWEPYLWGNLQTHGRLIYENENASETSIPDIRLSLKAPPEGTPEQIFILKIENCTHTQSHSFQFKIANYPEISPNEVNTFRAILKAHYTGHAQMLNLLTDTLKGSSSCTFTSVSHHHFSPKVSIQNSFLNDRLEENENLATLFQTVLHDTVNDTSILQTEFKFIEFCNLKNGDQKKRKYLYFILDPCGIDELPSREIEIFKKLLVKLIQNSPDSSKCATLMELIQLNLQLFIDFVNSIFYIGKGEDGRYKDHFKNAAAIHKSNETSVKKITPAERICAIWNRNKETENPILLFCIENVDDSEVSEREGTLISLLKTQLCNRINSGNRFLPEKPEERRKLGMYHLLQYFVLFLLNEKKNQMLLNSFQNDST